MSFTNSLIAWYSKNKRSLPWRERRSPYRVWLSEIILQQTRIDQGISYFHKFMERFPSVTELASAEESEVLKLWQGLGYYSRARNLHHAARQVVNEFGGTFPKNYDELLRLKGVGPYSAAAIASICFSEQVPVVDGNVFRFLSRHFGIDTPIDTTQGKREFRDLAAQLIPGEDPGTFNEAMMEFGAIMCTPKAPKCSGCPFNLSCFALKKGHINQLPVKAKKTGVKPLYIEFFIIQTPVGFYMQQRSDSGIWGGMYDFPGIWSSHAPSKKDITLKATELGITAILPHFVSDWYSHILTHRRISARFRIYKPDEFNAPHSLHLVQSQEDLELLALPRLIEKFIDECIFKEAGKIVT